jgi:hypothetical protein
MTPSRLKLLAVLAAAASLAACASGPTGVSAPAPRAPPPAARQLPPPPPPVIPAIERIRRAVDFLNHGQPNLARPELAAVVAEIPGDHTAVSLLEQIDRDPRALLGERNYPYKLRPGETLSMLAERFLGDPMLFYALSRYNGIDAPITVEVGRNLLIPGVPKRVAPAPAPPPVTPAKPPPPAAGVNPVRANQLRRTALEDMNKGAVDRAVALLQQAAALDPASTLIKADLERALRIQGSLKRR